MYNKNMTTKLPQPVHESYMKHRRDRAWKIIFPVVLSVLLCIAMVVLINVATFRDGGDVARWAAVSTIWIVIPIMFGMFLFLALLSGLVYLMYRLLSITPAYTGMAQDYVHKAAIYIKRGADAAVKPIIGLNGILAGINAFLEENDNSSPPFAAAGA
jgi:hypothetical protein